MKSSNDPALSLCNTFNELAALDPKRPGMAAALGFSKKQFGDVLISVAQTAAKAQAKELLPAGVSEVAKAVAVDLSGVVIGSVGGSLLRAILIGQDQTGKLLEKMRSEPFKTAQRMIQEAVSMPAVAPIELELKSNKLKHASLELEKAYTLASDDKERMLVRLIHGFCELELGALGFARHRFRDCANCLEQECREAGQRIDDLKGRLENIRQQFPDAYANPEQRLSKKWWLVNLLPMGCLVHFYKIMTSDDAVRKNVVAFREEVARLDSMVTKLRGFSQQLCAI